MPTIADQLPHFGSGIALRRLSAADLPVFQTYRADLELGRYQGWSAMSDAQARAFLEEMNAVPVFQPGKWTQLGIAEPEGLALLGDLGLFLSADSREAEIGYTLARSAQGRGLATAAVREALQLIFRLTCADHAIGITDARNHASIRLLERVGMRRLEERNAVFCGEPCVEYVYTVPRDDGEPALIKM